MFLTRSKSTRPILSLLLFLTFICSSKAEVSFVNSGQSLGDAFSITLGDLDGDGDLDIFLGSSSYNKIWLNDGNGNFTVTSASLGGYTTRAVVLGDIDGDGDLDAACANSPEADTSGYSRLWLNNGSAVFTMSSNSLSSYNVVHSSIDMGDLDGDGDLDIVIGNYDESGSAGQDKVFMNDGSGAFTNTQNLPNPMGDSSNSMSFNGNRTDYIKLGDADNDGDLDIFISSHFYHTIVYYNDGTGTFSNPGFLDISNPHHASVLAKQQYAPSYGAALGDFDKDGLLDMLTGENVYMNKGMYTVFDPINTSTILGYTTNFQVTTKTFGDAGNRLPTIADLDGDGNLDIIITNQLETPKVLLNDGTGADFSNSPQNLWHTNDVVTGDLDGDGDLDLITVSGDSQIWFNNPAAANCATLTVNATEGGTTIPNSPSVTKFLKNKAIKIKALPSDAYNFVNWTVVGDGTVADPNAESTTITLTGDATVTANFSNIITLTMAVNLAEGGSVSPTSGASSATIGSSIQITATPSDGYTFLYWIASAADTLIEDALNPQTTVNVFNSSTITAYFAPSDQSFIDYTLPIGSSNSVDAVFEDFDGDGDLDVFVANWKMPDKYWTNDGEGNFTDSELTFPNTTSDDTNTYAVASGDFNMDGKPDVIVLSDYEHPSQILRNDLSSSKTFVRTEMVFYGRDVAVGDLNGDGCDDIFVATFQSPAESSVHLNNGTGSLIDTGQALGTAFAVKLGDVDGDGDLDALVAEQTNVVIRLNDGSGTFSAATTLGPASTGLLALGDVDGDGDLDAIGGAKVFINNGSGTFTDSGQALTQTGSLEMADLDGDGDLDAFVVESWLNTDDTPPNKVLLNDGSGVFTDLGDDIGDSSSKGLALGDVDGDGDIDAFAANSDPANASTGAPNCIWFNNIVPADAVTVQVTVYPESSGSVKPASTFKVAKNKLFKITALPFSGYQFSNWSALEGTTITDANASITSASVTGDTELTANFNTTHFANRNNELPNTKYTIVELGDLDGDGDLDAVAGTADARDILLNDGSGNFSSKSQVTSFNESVYFSGVGIGDLDGDGDLDLFFTGFQGIQVWINDGDANFSIGQNSTFYCQYERPSLGDLDGDGDLDAFVISNSSTYPGKIYLNDGTGTFDNGAVLTDYTGKFSTLADFDADGDLDVFTGGESILLNDGTGVFTENQNIHGSKSYYATIASAADVDGDGDLDIIACHTDGIFIQLNDGAGTFTESGQYSSFSGSGISWSVSGDFDYDGDVDFFEFRTYSSSDESRNGNRIWLNDGTGTFQAVSSYTYGGENSNNYSAAIGDLNGDTFPDIFEARSTNLFDKVANTINITPDSVIWINQLDKMIKMTLFASPTSGGTTTPKLGVSMVNKEVAQNITATPATGYIFKDWTATENATIADSSSTTTTVTLTGDASITANFVATAQLTIFTAPTDGGTSTPAAGTTTVNQGEEQNITATAASGYVFKDWTATENATIADSSSAETTVTLSGDASVTANFLATSQLTMAASPTAGGTSSPVAGTSTVTQGVEQNITATAAEGYVFKDWTATENATIADSSSTETTVTLSGDATVTANFIATAKLTMAASPTAGGTTTPVAGASTVIQGVEQNITVTAAEGYVFKDWTATENATIADSSSTETTVILSGDATVTANFITKVKLTMALSPTAGGLTIPSAGTTTVNQGEAQNISATATSEYVFKAWTTTEGALVADSSSSSTTVTLTADATVTAEFVLKENSLTLTMEVTPENSGTTTPSETATVEKDVAQNITATAANGYIFKGWTGTEGATIADSTAASSTVTLTTDATVTAEFSPATTGSADLTMAVSPENSGTTDPSVGTHSVDINVAQNISATAAEGYYFSGWVASTNATVADTSSSSTTVTITGDATVSAAFSTSSPETFKLSMVAQDGGTTSPEAGTETSLYAGIAQTITATAGTGYSFSGWSANPANNVSFESSSSASTTVTLTGDATITASFSKSTAQTGVLTMAASPNTGGETTPEVGQSTIYLGVAQSINATAATGYSFVGWQASGNATIASSSSASTTVTLTGDAVVTALFSAGTTSTGSLTVNKAKITLRGDKENADQVSVTFDLPSDFAYDNTSDDLKIIVGTWELTVDKGSEWKTSSKQVYSAQTDLGKVKIIIDEKKSIILLKVSKTSIVGKVNSSEGVDFYLVTGDKYYWDNCDMDEKSSWKSTGVSTLEDGFDSKVVKFKGKYLYSDGGEKEAYNFAMIGTDLSDPTTDGFTTDLTPVIQIDGATWEIDADEPKGKNGKFIYKVREDDLKLYLKLDFNKGKWMFKVSEKDSDTASDVYKNGSSQITLTFEGVSADEEWSSVNSIPSAIKSTLSYKKE